MKQIYTFLSLFLLAMVGFAQPTSTNTDNVKYQILDNNAKTAKVIQYDSKPIGAITILEKVTINSEEYTVVSVGLWAFYDCADITSIIIPNSVTSIGIGAFQKCSSLTSITIPNSVTTIASDAFYECFSITSITIPNSVNYIGEQVFMYCSNLTSVTLGDSLSTIGYNAFFDCTSLTRVISLSDNPTLIFSADFVFSNINSNAELIIPTDTGFLYNLRGWSSYFLTVTESSSLNITTNTIEGLKLFTNNREVKTNLNNVSLEVYNVNGKKVANSNLKKGLYIVVAKNKEGKMHTQKVIL